MGYTQLKVYSDDKLKEIRLQKEKEANEQALNFKNNFEETNKEILNKKKEELFKNENKKIEDNNKKFESNNLEISSKKEFLIENNKRIDALKIKLNDEEKIVNEKKIEHENLLNNNIELIKNFDKQINKIDDLVAGLTNEEFKPFLINMENEINENKEASKKMKDELANKIKDYNSQELQKEKDNLNSIISNLNKELENKKEEIKKLELDKNKKPDEEIKALKIKFEQEVKNLDNEFPEIQKIQTEIELLEKTKEKKKKKKKFLKKKKKKKKKKKS